MEGNITKLSRPELEDKLYNTTQENVELKKLGNSQNEKMKQLATKILRLKSDMKKIQAGKAPKYMNENDVIDELKVKIVNLEHENNSLKQKIKVLRNNKQQETPNQKHYKFVEPRVDTGMPYKPIFYTPNKSSVKKPRLQQFGSSLLQSARKEIHELDDIVDNLNSRIQQLEEENRELISHQQDIELSYENKILAIREQVVDNQKNGLSEDIELINLKRDLKEKDDMICDLEAKLLTARNIGAQGQQRHDNTADKCKQLQIQVEALQTKLKMSRNAGDDSMMSQNQELSMMLEEAQSERDILKDENQRLIDGVFNTAKERKYKENEKKLRERIKQLEFRLENLQVDVSDHVNPGELFDKYLSEKTRAGDLAHEVNILKIKNKELSCLLVQTQEQMEKAEKELVHSKQNARIDVQKLSPTPEPICHHENNESWEKELSDLQIEYASLVTELEKANNLLDVQYKLNKVYQDESISLKVKYDNIRRNYDKQESENAKLLDIRAHKINKLEMQLRDIAYGTKPVKIDAVNLKDESHVYLEKGQNILNVHLGKLFMSHDDVVNSDEQLLMVLNFYHFESLISRQVLPINADFNTTSKFIVNTDQNFLNSLKYDLAQMYLYACSGSTFRCIAGGKVSFKDLLSQDGGKTVYSSVQLLGINGDLTGLSLATLEYNFSLLYPIAHALSLYREREKANLYIESSQSRMDSDDIVTRDDCNNELKVSIFSCSDLKTNSTEQPSPYVVYKFYTFGDHDTSIIPNSNNPQFNDVKVYPISVDKDLHSYLSGSMFRIYVFNDSDLDYLMGFCDIPLLQLAHDLIIEGSFEIKDSKEKVIGTVKIRLEWLLTYTPPSNITPSKPWPSRAVPITETEGITPQVLQLPKDAPEEVQSESAQVVAEAIPQVEKLTYSLEKVEKPKTDFISFRSVDDYNRAVAAQKRKEMPDNVSSDVQPVAEVGNKIIEYVPSESIDETEDDSDDVVLGTFTPSPLPDPNQQLSRDLDDDPLDRTFPDEPKNMDNTFFEEKKISSDEDNDIVLGGSLKPLQPDFETDSLDDISEHIADNDFDDDDDLATVSQDDNLLMSSTLGMSGNLEPSSETNAPPIVITIHYVNFYHTAFFFRNTKDPIKVYVEYRFLAFDPEDTETPQSLPALPGENVKFDHMKTFFINCKSMVEKKLLRDLVELGNKLTFTVLCDPENSEEDCTDLCKAEVGFPKTEDIIKEDMDLISEDGLCVGVVNITIEACATLRWLKLTP